jgi:hypothetical protein
MTVVMGSASIVTVPAVIFIYASRTHLIATMSAWVGLPLQLRVEPC